jgi:hypothetical protein
MVVADIEETYRPYGGIVCGCDADRRVATPRFTSCPVAILSTDAVSNINASPGYGLASTFREDALHTRQVLCITEVV